MNTTHNISNLQLTIQGYQAFSIPTGQFGLDGGAMFGTVPKVLWEKSFPADSQNRIPMEARALLLIHESYKILVDTGNGDHFLEKYGDKLGSKFESLYNISSHGPTLEKSLNQLDLTCDDITHVFLTHLHFDHAGGATTFANNKVEARFKNAKYYVQKNNLETALNPNIREKASYLEANFLPLIESGHLVTLDGPQTNWLPHIDILVSNGHTHGQQHLLLKGHKSSLFYGADLIPTHAHIRKAWIMGYDLDPLTLIKEKSEILDEAHKNNWYLFFEHDPWIEVAQIQKDKNDYKMINPSCLDNNLNLLD